MKNQPHARRAAPRHPQFIEATPEDVIRTIQRIAAGQSTCMVSIFAVAASLGVDSIEERDWLLDVLSDMDERGEVLLAQWNEPQKLPEWERSFQVFNALSHPCHEVCVNPDRVPHMNWQAENGRAEINDLASAFTAAAAASLQVMAGESAGLSLDHRSLMRRANPTDPSLC